MLTGSYGHITYGVSDNLVISGSYYPASEYMAYHNYNHEFPSFADDLWERMYVQPKPVIVVCRYCQSHNAISNPVCIQCGAPMGTNKVVQY